MTGIQDNLRLFWERLSRTDLIAIVLVLAGLAAYFAAPNGGIFGLLKFFALLALLYLLVRFIGWWRNRLLWSLRNRLIVAYLFIALVPVLLVTLLAVQAGLLLYSQLGGYLLYDDMQKRIEMLDDGAAQIASALAASKQNVTAEFAEHLISAQQHEVYDARLPGLEIAFTTNEQLFRQLAGSKRTFSGLIQQGNNLSLAAIRSVMTPAGTRYVELRVPVTGEFVSTLAPDLGQVLVDLVEPRETIDQRGISFRVNNRQYMAIREIRAKGRVLPPRQHWLDREVTGFSRFDAVRLSSDGKSAPVTVPVVGSFSARPSQLNSRMFLSVGDLSYLNFLLFFVLAGVLLLIEGAALITGVVMTRRITQAVDDLYNATQYVQQRDFSHRVKIASRDQLGVLGESFNLMTESIGNLIEEQARRQRLENELSIAREVQNQLFPQTLPAIPGVDIEAICKPARTVSGDYYDFIQISPTQLAIAVADISGKGISAALLMASLQAALRSQLLAEESKSLSTAELVVRLNRHLFRNTGDDRFATFFIAVYDASTRVLRYTNAGHLPSFCICDSQVMNLDVGGIVLGVVDDYPYEEGTVVVPGGALLIGYSDGLVEPENVYGEEFGIARLRAAAVSLQRQQPREVANGLMQAAEEWAGTAEQADDMTVIVAELR